MEWKSATDFKALRDASNSTGLKSVSNLFYSQSPIFVYLSKQNLIIYLIGIKS